MMLVDNFKVILLVVLICAAGLQLTEALNCTGSDGEMNKNGDPILWTVTCETGKWCSVSKDNKRGCDAPSECKPTEEMYCCGTDDDCNTGLDVCIKSPKIKTCDKAIKNLEEICKQTPKRGGCEEFRKKMLGFCKAHPGLFVEVCEEIKKQLQDECKGEPGGPACEAYKESTGGGGAAGTYGGISIPIVTLVSAFLYYIPLNFFL